MASAHGHVLSAFCLPFVFLGVLSDRYGLREIHGCLCAPSIAAALFLLISRIKPKKAPNKAEESLLSLMIYKVMPREESLGLSWVMVMRGFR